MSTSKFDLGEFNKSFVSKANELKHKRKAFEKEKLDKLNTQQNYQKSVLNQTVGEILINTKKTWFEILDNILESKFEINIFENNHLFYIGITILFISLILIISEQLQQ